MSGEKTGQRTAQVGAMPGLDRKWIAPHRQSHGDVCIPSEEPVLGHAGFIRRNCGKHEAHPCLLCSPTFVVDRYNLRTRNHRLMSLMNDVPLGLFDALARTRLSISVCRHNNLTQNPM